MTKLLLFLVSASFLGCTTASSRNSVGSAEAPLAARGDCDPCSPCCDVPCPPDCGEVCTFVCSDPVGGECVVTLRCDGDTCTVVSCEPLAPGQSPPPGARRIECAAACGMASGK